MTIVYHGTTTKALPSILQHGVRGSRQSFEGRVYVSTNPTLPADIAQIAAGDTNSVPVLLTIDTKKRLHRDPEYPSEDFGEGFSLYVKGVIPVSEIISTTVGRPTPYGDFDFSGVD